LAWHPTKNAAPPRIGLQLRQSADDVAWQARASPAQSHRNSKQSAADAACENPTTTRHRHAPGFRTIGLAPDKKCRTFPNWISVPAVSRPRGVASPLVTDMARRKSEYEKELRQRRTSGLAHFSIRHQTVRTDIGVAVMSTFPIPGSNTAIGSPNDACVISGRCGPCAQSPVRRARPRSPETTKPALASRHVHRN
jgi:hypothetical protein